MNEVKKPIRSQSRESNKEIGCSTKKNKQPYVTTRNQEKEKQFEWLSINFLKKGIYIVMKVRDYQTKKKEKSSAELAKILRSVLPRPEKKI